MKKSYKKRIMNKITNNIKSLIIVGIFILVIILLSKFDVVEDEKIKNTMVQDAKIQRVLNIESRIK